MLGAARTGAWAKSGGIVNPYADDAMLFMFDGIWNDGIGKHVDTMQGEYIKNCVDGIGDMPVSNTNSKPFPWLDLESDCFYHNANIFANRKGPLEIQVPANEMTIELVIDISGAAKDACVNKKAAYCSGIGPLTIATLVNRIAVHNVNGV